MHFVGHPSGVTMIGDRPFMAPENPHGVPWASVTYDVEGPTEGNFEEARALAEEAFEPDVRGTPMGDFAHRLLIDGSEGARAGYQNRMRQREAEARFNNLRVVQPTPARVFARCVFGPYEMTFEWWGGEWRFKDDVWTM